MTGRSPEDCLTSAARREMACLLDHAKPQPRKTFLLPTDYDVHPREHTSLLSEFLRLAPLLVPSESGLSALTLRHPDLSLANILLVPGSTEIASIIDGLQIPKLPEDFHSMSTEGQIEAKTTFQLEEANLYFMAATGMHNNEHIKVLRIPHNPMRKYLIQQTGYPWDGDIISLRAALVGITSAKFWGSISDLPCPVSFGDEEREKAMRESSEWNESKALLSIIRNDLGIDLEGRTEPGKWYECAVARNREFRMEMLRQSEVHEREICWRNL
ncbi:hypothetical protein AJ80_05078 [Polytolypa hystricis UAMH7299]|uniref:Aminoglycoside phosphotransferase domain-containing protein n=1 Tax=Polytolypa hystricis (strain UAMH7299) TaxID=1447883 RepID=A0A2B7Y6U6_POLH7|nr:hypothetical protein AJ80_05078 [Polytolypa hystricis UAMH7299]